LKIVVNHLTRMQPGYICVAGLDLQTNAHVRPVLDRSRLTVNLLKRKGGPFDIAVVIDLGDTKPQGTPPEIEDHLFDPGQLTAVKELSAERFWKLLKSVSRSTITEIFGKKLQAQRKGCAVDEGTGSASLGCLLPAVPPEVFINSWGNIRARINDGVFNVELSVTDLRFYKDDQHDIQPKVVTDVQRRIKKGIGVVISVGLARAFVAKGDNARRHWLQVNNIHLEDDPTWQAL
jgi:hypothetical protein